MGWSVSTISQMWRRNWEHLTPFFAYPADIRKVIYTTNAVESLNMSLRKVIKTRGSFPTQEAARKLLYLALEHIAKKWTMPNGGDPRVVSPASRAYAQARRQVDAAWHLRDQVTEG